MFNATSGSSSYIQIHRTNPNIIQNITEEFCYKGLAYEAIPPQCIKPQKNQKSLSRVYRLSCHLEVIFNRPTCGINV
jgi:hypothetical protein